MGNSENTSYWGEHIPRLEDYGARGRLNVRSIKLFTDGALGSWGAALLDPYTDKPDTRGIMRVSEERLEAFVKWFWEDGWGVVRPMFLFTSRVVVCSCFVHIRTFIALATARTRSYSTFSSAC